MADPGYVFSATSGNRYTITLFTEAGEDQIWGFTGPVQLRTESLNGRASTTVYRVSQAGFQDILIPYSEILSFAGDTPPTGDPVADFALFLASFPTFAAS